MAESGAVQSRLLTMRAACAVELEERLNLHRGCARTQSATVSLVLSVRSDVGFGSPMRPVAPPTSASGRWPGQLEATHREDLHEVADVQAGRGGVETAVVGDRPSLERRAHRLRVGRLRYESAPVQLVEDVRHVVSSLCRARSSLPDPALAVRRGLAAR